MEQDMETVVHDGWNTAVDWYIGTGDICRTGNRMSDRREWQGFDQRRQNSCWKNGSIQRKKTESPSMR